MLKKVMITTAITISTVHSTFTPSGYPPPSTRNHRPQGRHLSESGLRPRLAPQWEPDEGRGQ